MTVYDIATGKVIRKVPTLEYLTGTDDLPLWFAREANSMLQAKERYAVCAGIGLVARISHLLCLNPRGIDADACVERCTSFTEQRDALYKQSIIEEFNYEVEDIISGFGTACRLHDRGAVGVHQQIRLLKQRRDDLESVRYVCNYVNKPPIRDGLPGTRRIDAVARAYHDKLQDNHKYCSVIEPRLNLIHRNFPEFWWGVKGTI